jgi:hypothetical protein
MSDHHHQDSASHFYATTAHNQADKNPSRGARNTSPCGKINKHGKNSEVHISQPSYRRMRFEMKLKPQD